MRLLVNVHTVIPPGHITWAVCSHGTFRDATMCELAASLLRSSRTSMRVALEWLKQGLPFSPQFAVTHLTELSSSRTGTVGGLQHVICQRAAGGSCMTDTCPFTPHSPFRLCHTVVVALGDSNCKHVLATMGAPADDLSLGCVVLDDCAGLLSCQALRCW